MDHAGRLNRVRVTFVAMVVLLFSSVVGAQIPENVTFTRDVAPILQQKCEVCHRSGQLAPMSLGTVEEVRPWARAIQRKGVSRQMPPCHMDKTVGIQVFANDISLSDEQIATIVHWVETGSVRGDMADLPPPVEWPRGDVWRLAEPVSYTHLTLTTICSV